MSSPVEVSEDRFVLAGNALEELARRLARTRVPTDLGVGWEQGVPNGWLSDLLDDWRRFDPDVLQRRLDGLRQFRAEVQGRALHVVVAEGRGPDPMPLLLRHTAGQARSWSTSNCCRCCLTPVLTARTRQTPSR